MPQPTPRSPRFSSPGTERAGTATQDPVDPRRKHTARPAAPTAEPGVFRARPPVKRLPADDTLTKEEAAAYANVTKRTIGRWIAQGSLNKYVVKINHVAVSKTELDALLTARHEA